MINLNDDKAILAIGLETLRDTKLRQAKEKLIEISREESIVTKDFLKSIAHIKTRLTEVEEITARLEKYYNEEHE